MGQDIILVPNSNGCLSRKDRAYLTDLIEKMKRALRFPDVEVTCYEGAEESRIADVSHGNYGQKGYFSLRFKLLRDRRLYIKGDFHDGWSMIHLETETAIKMRGSVSLYKFFVKVSKSKAAALGSRALNVFVNLEIEKL